MSNMSNGNSSSDAEKDFAEHLHEHMEPQEALRKIQTAGSISISPELFEKLYLQPRAAAGPGASTGIRNIVGTPTPVGLAGFLLCLTPLTCDLMGWRGSQSQNGTADIGVYFFFGGLMMTLCGIGEFLVGSTFPSVVFFSFGAFWLTWGITLTPMYGIGQVYAGAAGVPVAMGEATPGFLNAFGFFFLWMGVLCFFFMICALRTNICFFIIFFTLVFAFALLTAAFWVLAAGEAGAAAGAKIVVAAGAFAFITCCSGWWIFVAILLQSVDFPVALPLGDLSSRIKGKSEKSMA